MAVAVWTSFEQITTSNGVPHTSVQVNVYAAGTTTPLTVYSDSGLSALAANPIEADGSGQHAMRYIAATSYKTVVTALVSGVRTTLTNWTKDNIDPGVPIGSGALAIANGGTGATTAGAALTALGGATAAEVAAVAADVASLAGAASSSEKTHIATGTTAQRPSTPVEGDIRRNTTTGEWEGYTSSWELFRTSADAAATSDIAAETSQDTYLRPDRAKHGPWAAKAWAKVTITAGTPALSDGYNVSGTITDNGPGDYTFTFTNAMANTNYAVIASAYFSSGGAANISIRPTSIATGSVRLEVQSGSSPSASDPATLHFVIFGDI